MSDNIKVVVKVRPLISREVEEKQGYFWRVRNNTIVQLDHNGRETENLFTFDKVYDKNTKTKEVYDDVAKPIVEAAVSGFNGTIFAYGQTSSGKTYTMTGNENSPGIIPLAVLNLFNIIKQAPNRDFLIRVSYIEIYNETLKDLLQIEKKNIKVHETCHGSVKVDVTEKVTASPEEVLEIMKEGEANRQTGATNMNEESSRSHSIFQITIESREHVEGSEEGGCVNVSQLNLVDLAGSERAGQTGATGLRFKEGTHINKSLSCLALVIKQLSEDPNRYVNFRDSKLTRILQNSLGGNAKTSIICAVTPASIEETVSTLKFANRAKAIKNKPQVNAVATDATMIQSLTKELSKLQSELAVKRTLLQTKENLEQDLQKQIASLQKLILNGFGQRSSKEELGPKRKLQPPRRVTISTLHNIEEEPVPSVPKFCTPSLKYNPMALSTEFIPIQNTNKLTSVPEEARMITPPPGNQKTIVHDEIIELDSDDDNEAQNVSCSPYHSCYVSSKTPPCVLRKNAKLAEKSLKDIVELTEREKMYTPNVVELLEKHDKNTAVIEQLQEKINDLLEKSREKDLKIEELKTKIEETENKVNVITSDKTALETKCKNYDIQITDWEVSYETLSQKSKNRERDLLSLLEEQRSTKAEDFGKTTKAIDRSLINLLDMSKDISLVNSDNESTTNIHDEPTLNVHELVKDLQSQIIIKNQTITDLESNISNQQQKIDLLEKSTLELQTTLENFNIKISSVNTENLFLKSTIDSLTSSIENQKKHLENANKDIKSYNDTIQELQIKLIKKDSILDVKTNESVLENMIANEQNFIANNENMKNIILSFKIALNSKNKEIDNLKSTIQENLHIKELIDVKEKQIITLMTEIEKFKEHLDENMSIINRLMKVEQELTSQLSSLTKENDILLKQNDKFSTDIMNLTTLNSEYKTKIEDFQTKYEELNRSVEEKSINEQTLSKTNEEQLKLLDDMSLKIIDLEKQLNDKVNKIKSIHEEANVTQEQTNKLQLIIKKLHSALQRINSNTEIVPENMNNQESVICYLNNEVDALEAVIMKVTDERDKAIQVARELNEKLSSTTDFHNCELSNLQSKVNETNSEFKKQSENLLSRVSELTEELESKKSYIINIEVQLNDAEENNGNLRIDILSKEKDIASLKDQLTNVIAEIEETKSNKQMEIATLNTNLINEKNSLEQLRLEKISEISLLEEQLSNATFTVETNKEVIAALKGTIENRDKLLLGIFKKVYKLAVGSEIEILQMEADSVYEQIIQNLDKVSDMIILLKTENDVERNEIQEVLTNAKKDLDDLTEQNLKLLNQLKEICEHKDQLLLEIQKVNSLNEELTKACESLKDLNVELRRTSKQEIQSLENKAEELAIRLEKNENLMKEKMDAVMKENERLKDMMHCRVTESTDFSLDCSKKSDLSDSDNFDSTTPQSLMTICFNKIMNTLQSSDADYTSLSTTSSKTIARSYVESETQTVGCECESLSQQLYTAIEQKNKLTEEVNNLKVAYNYLLEEREEVRKEIQSLVEPASELQKKIYNHRTNLSTLTATTYAENKLLHSQLKVLKHHHTRYINVCQRDLPAFKSNLNELMTILKGSIFLTDKHSANFKRYSLPDVLDSDTSVSTFKNESTFDADLLMLDTNVTLTTADNTLVGHDQTSFETSQIHFDTEVCQTNSKEIDPCLILQIETLTNENVKLVEQLSIVQEENSKLKGEHQQSFVLQSSLLETSKSSSESVIHKDTQCSSIKITTAQDKVTQTLNEPEFCKNCENFCSIQNKLNNDVINLTQTLKQVQTQKEEFEQKFNHLNLEMPSIDALRRKLSNLEKDHQSKAQEIDKLSRELKEKHKKLKDLQEENDTLSNQVFENISEIDSLKEEFDKLKEINSQLIEKNSQLEMIAKSSEDILNNKTYCSKCEMNDEIINSLQNNQEHSKLGRSLSDSDSSSRYNKICTLQSELNASKEDCKKITEEVATIKNHLERNNISMGQAMDLDESLEKSNIFTFTKDFGTDKTNKIKCEIETTDLYLTDKSDCLNFYIETTGADKENLNRDVKIIDIMKMLYSNLITKHGNEVENLSNKLIDFEESKIQLQTQLHNATMDCSNLMNQLHQSDKNSTSLNKVITKIRDNVNLMQKEMSGNDEDKNLKLVTLFKEDVLKLLDIDFELSLVNIFGTLIDNIVNKYHKDLSQSLDQYEKLQNHMATVMAEFKIISENLNQIKLQLTEKEAEYNLLKTQKERIHEISNAVTLDIVKKEQELNKVLSIGCNKLSKLNITCPFGIHDTVPLDEKLSILFESIVSKIQDINENTIDKQNLISEISSLHNTLEVKEQTVTTLNEKLTNAENNLQHLQSIHENLVKICENKDRENEANINVIKKINLEIESLKEIVLNKEVFIQSLENKISQETIDKPNDKLEDLKQEYEKLKHINELINKEKDVYADELMKAQEVICRNKAELERMTSDILVLRESVNDNVSIIESLTLEAKTLMEQNLLLKKQFEEKCRDCSRLEMNIKTHEKSVEIQNKMITRLKNQKEDDDKSALDKDRSLKEITDKFIALQEECENLKKLLEANKEAQLSELDAGCEGRRNKVVVTPQDARRRRQSFYDSRRVIIDDKADNDDDHNKIEAMFGSRGKPDDLFANVDEDSSNRSTPVRLSRGRDSLLSGQDQSDKEEDHSRPSSVAEVRRRRQSIHDSHRASLAREPHLNHSQKYSEEVVNMKPDILGGNSTESDVNQLREKLVSLQSEMEELRERNRELDDECETCAQYLHERDEQCRRLKKENTALERQLAELNEKLNCSHNRSHGVTPSVAHASVNTDADWANLHSVVVDRMSFDAEVEKNKRMTRTIEELRCNKQELKNTIAKMQRALEKNAAYKEAKELEATKAELGRCKLELSELQTRYRELDEECETCAQYLRERDDQCRKLREAKHALEARVLELQEAAGDAALAARRKRRTAHDLQRHPPPPHHASDAHTDTGDDLLSYQVERDEESTKGHNAQALELKRVKNALDKVLKEKAVLENKLLAATMPNVNPTMYVATGSAIVQNQQITDVMKENQKLKKINAKLVNICKKRGKPQDANIENEEPSDLG